MSRFFLFALLGGLVPAAFCAPFSLRLSAGCLIGSAVAALSFRIVFRQFSASIERGSTNKFLLFLSFFGKLIITAAGLLLAAKIGAPAVAGLFAGVVGALAGVLVVALKGSLDASSD